MRAGLVRKLAVAVATCSVVAGCTLLPTKDEAPLLEITPQQPWFAAGALAYVQVRNLTSQGVTYDTCEPRVERRVAGGWVRTPSPLVMCAARMGFVDAGQTTQEAVILLSELEPGTYRAVFLRVSTDARSAAGVEQPSQPFEVRLGPQPAS